MHNATVLGERLPQVHTYIMDDARIMILTYHSAVNFIVCNYNVNDMTMKRGEQNKMITIHGSDF